MRTSPGLQVNRSNHGSAGKPLSAVAQFKSAVAQFKIDLRTPHPSRRPRCYSYLRAIIGSMRVARRAGTRQAAKATSESSSAMPANTLGSVALTP